MTSDKERRKKPRVEGKVLVKLLADDQELMIYTGNLSKTGMFLETNVYVGEVGDTLPLEISTPSLEKKLKIKGQITRLTKANQVSNHQGIAIVFTKLESRHSKTLDQLLEALFESKGLGCRKHPRAQTNLLIEIKNIPDLQKVIAEDVSHGGMFLKAPTSGISIGDTLNMIIIHPSSKRKSVVEAEVMHIRKGESSIHKQFSEGLGVQFIGLSASKKKDLASFLKSILFSNRKSIA